MKKVLIWDNFPLANIGGPSGYLFNIHEYLRDNPCPNIVFLSDILIEHPILVGESDNKDQITLSKESLCTKIKSFFKKVYPQKSLLRYINGLLRRYKFYMNIYHNDFYKTTSQLKLETLNEFDYVHFHFVPTVMRFKVSYPDYKGKLILTSHSPCPWTDEMIDLYKPFMKKFFYKKSINNECKVYSASDYLMFPCEEAMEPYKKNSRVNKIFNERKGAFFFVPTSILDLSKVIRCNKQLSDFNIPPNAFIISFIGRHHSVKGYDIIKKVGNALLAKYPDLYFLCAGAGPIEPLHHVRWIELGFIDYASDLYSLSDLYIVANRDTYFDMGTLEVLRSGTHILLSNTGGNKYFKRLSSKDTATIRFFDVDDIDGLIQMVENSIHDKQNDSIRFKNSGECNRNLYLKYFTPQRYVDTYLNSIDKLF